MNRDPFLRAALILALTGAAAVLYAFFGPWRALVFAGVGVVVAILVAQDWSPSPAEEQQTPEPSRRRRRIDREGHPIDFERVA